MVNIFRNDGLNNVKCFVNLKYKKEISVFLQDPFRSSIASAVLTIGTGPYILFYTQSNDNLSTVLSQDEAVLAAN